METKLNLPENVEDMLCRFIRTAHQMREICLQLANEADQARYANVDRLILAGRLSPRVIVQADTLAIILIDTRSGEIVGPAFEYRTGAMSPAADARGDACLH